MQIVGILAAPLGILAAASLAAHWVQAPARFSGEKLKPRFLAPQPAQRLRAKSLAERPWSIF